MINPPLRSPMCEWFPRRTVGAFHTHRLIFLLINITRARLMNIEPTSYGVELTMISEKRKCALHSNNVHRHYTDRDECTAHTLVYIDSFLVFVCSTHQLTVEVQRSQLIVIRCIIISQWGEEVLRQITEKR